MPRSIRSLNSLEISGSLRVTGSSYFDVSSANTALRVTQRGAGDAIRVEDSPSTDTSPFIVKSDGRVGIGVENPTQALHVNGNITATSSLGIMLDSQDLPLITRGWDKFGSGPYTGAGRWGLFMSANTLHAGIPNITGKSFTISVFGGDSSFTPLFIVQSSNQITASVPMVVDVSSTQTALRVTQKGSGDAIRVEDDLTSPDSTPFIVKSDGQVGIGTATPSASLDIRGGLLISNNLNQTSSVNSSFSVGFGLDSRVPGTYAFSQGYGNIASGTYSHAQGFLSVTSGGWSHAEGEGCVTLEGATGAHAEGQYTIASASYQHVQGKFNQTSSALMIVGNGGSVNSRSNILEVYSSTVGVTGSVLVTNGTFRVTASNTENFIDVSNNTNALRITQKGSGDAIKVEDETSPDATPFVVKADGRVGIGTAEASDLLDIKGGAIIVRPQENTTNGGWNGIRHYYASTPTGIPNVVLISKGEYYQYSTGSLAPNGAYGLVFANAGGNYGTWLTAPASSSTGGSGRKIGFAAFNSDSTLNRTLLVCDTAGSVLIGGDTTKDTVSINARTVTFNVLEQVGIGASMNFSSYVIIDANSNFSSSLRITQRGSNHALIVEDEASDSSPFIIRNDGKLSIGIPSATAVTNTVTISGSISGSHGITGSFSGSGELINNLTASNINNFISDVRKQISGTGVISYDPSTGVISYAGAGGTIVTEGNITGSGVIGDAIRTKPDVSFTNVTSSYFTGSSAKLDYIDFVASTPAFSVGRLYYDINDEILKFNLPYENTELNIGKQLIAKVKNNTGLTITKGKVVYVNGSQGSSEILYVTTASWENDNTSANTIGFTMSELADQDIGYIILEGILEGVNTNGYTGGDLIYLSSSGDFTNIKPTQPNHAVRLGHIARVQDPNGSIFVRIQNGFELDELHDVLLSSPQNYDLLMRDTDGLWKNTKTLSGSYTILNNLTASNFVGSLTGSFSSSNPSIIDANSSTTALRITQRGAGNAIVVEDGPNPDASPFIVDANGFVGIGTSSNPSYRLTIFGDVLLTGSDFTGYGSNKLRLYDSNTMILRSGSADNYGLALSVAGGDKLNILNNGNVGIGTTQPASKLHVVGTALVTNGVTASAASSFTQVTASVGFKGRLFDTASYALDADRLDNYNSSDFALLAASNTFTAPENIFNNNVTINGTASIAQLNTINQTSLVVGDKYITILSGSNTHVQMDGAGILFGSGSTDETIGDQNSVAHIVYRKGNAPSDYISDYIEVYPSLRTPGVLSGSNLTGSNTGDETTATIKSKLGTAGAASEGYLTQTDWNTFNNKQGAITLTTTGHTGSATLVGNTLNIPQYVKYIPPVDGNEFYRGFSFTHNSTTVTAIGGVVAGGTYAGTAQSVASTNTQTKQIRLRIGTATPASGKVATIRGSSAWWYIGGGFRYVCSFGISDTSFASTARQFYGMSSATGDLAFGTISGITVRSLFNQIGFGSDDTDTNLQFIYNDGSGASSVYDLGSNFPANRTAGAALTNWYSCQIYNPGNYDTRIFFSILNLENGAYLEDVITSSDVPSTTTALNFHAARSMNTAGGGSGQGQFDLGRLGVFSF